MPKKPRRFVKVGVKFSEVMQLILEAHQSVGKLISIHGVRGTGVEGWHSCLSWYDCYGSRGGVVDDEDRW